MKKEDYNSIRDILREFDDVLEPIYKIMEASEAEDIHCKVGIVAKKLLLSDKYINKSIAETPGNWILSRKSEIYNNWSPLGKPSDLACTVRAIMEFLDKEYKDRNENTSNSAL